jgi:hypothetical protein
MAAQSAGADGEVGWILGVAGQAEDPLYVVARPTKRRLCSYSLNYLRSLVDELCMIRWITAATCG